MKSVIALSMLAGAEAAETVLGAYIFHRHGDRTAKALASTELTTLGYEQVYTSGQYYRSRYLSGDSKISGINEDEVKLSQLQVQSPADNVLQTSAIGFLQGLYPPVQTVQTLSNGQDVQAPLNGYQLIPINTIQTGAGSEDAGWLQDASSCQNAKISSNSYFDSSDYHNLASSTKDFYTSIVPSINNVISDDEVSFKNAYVVYDTINVAEIHNSTIPNSNTLTNSTLTHLRTLASAHEWGLAYNASDNMRAVAGMQLAGKIISYLDSIISSKGDKKLGVQFGAYATFMSFFGLADLHKTNQDFAAIVEYASSMVFELFTETEAEANAQSTSFPAMDDIKVRFLFHNGTASNTSEPTVYPLFDGKDDAVSWNVFQDKLNDFAIRDTEQWCGKCGVKTGECAGYANGNKDVFGQLNGGDGGISPAVGGVIGAFVTLVVVLGSVALVVLVGGVRLVSKKALARGVPTTSVETKA